MTDRCRWPRHRLCLECIDETGTLAGLDAAQSAALIDEAYALGEARVEALVGHGWPGDCGQARLRICDTGAWCPDPCGCGYRRWDMSVALHGQPVHEVVAWDIDGADQSLTAGGEPRWRIDDDRWLVRQDRVCDGCAASPVQNLAAPAGAAGTWSVTVRYGRRPTPLMLAAAAEIAEDHVRRCLPKRCGQPRGTVSVSEQGRRVDVSADAASPNMAALAAWAANRSPVSTLWPRPPKIVVADRRWPTDPPPSQDGTAAAAAAAAAEAADAVPG